MITAVNTVSMIEGQAALIRILCPQGWTVCAVRKLYERVYSALTLTNTKEG